MDVGRFFGTELFGFCKADVLHYIELSANEQEEEKAQLKKEISELSAKLKEAENTVAIISAQYDNQMNVLKSKEATIRDMTKNLAVCKQKIRQLTLNNPLNGNVLSAPQESFPSDTLGNASQQSQYREYTEKLEREVEGLRGELSNYVNNVKEALTPFINNASSHVKNASAEVEKLQKEIETLRQMTGLAPRHSGSTVGNTGTAEHKKEAVQAELRREKYYQQHTDAEVVAETPDSSKRVGFSVHPIPQSASFKPAERHIENPSEIGVSQNEHSVVHDESHIDNPFTDDSEKSNKLLRENPHTITNEQMRSFLTAVEEDDEMSVADSCALGHPSKNEDCISRTGGVPRITMPRAVEPTIDGKDIEAFLNMDIDSIINPSDN